MSAQFLATLQRLGMGARPTRNAQELVTRLCARGLPEPVPRAGDDGAIDLHWDDGDVVGTMGATWFWFTRVSEDGDILVDQSWQDVDDVSTLTQEVAALLAPVA